jgi:hypothetical protein
MKVEAFVFRGLDLLKIEKLAILFLICLYNRFIVYSCIQSILVSVIQNYFKYILF